MIVHLDLIGKVGAILASIPQALAASILCFMWALIVAIGLSNLQYTQSASFRNIMIVGASLFLGLSIPAYFQQYHPETSLILPSYFVPFAAASNGPVHTGSKQVSLCPCVEFCSRLMFEHSRSCLSPYLHCTNAYELIIHY